MYLEELSLPKHPKLSENIATINYDITSYFLMQNFIEKIIWKIIFFCRNKSKNIV